MLNMESPQMYDTVQTLSQLDLKKPPSSAIIGQITLTAMANANSNNNNNNNNNTNNNNNNSATTPNNNITQNGAMHHNGNGLVVKQQQSAHHMQQAAANNNNNNNTTNNNNNSILQKHMLQQYTQNDLDELTAGEITLDLQHLIDDQFREQDALGIFSEMVASPNGLTNSNLQTNGVVSKVLQLQHQQQQQNLRTQQNHAYGRNALAYMPQAVHSGATYTNNSSDDNSSVGSEASTIKEEPIDPQEFRRQMQDVSGGAFNGSNGNANGLYHLNGGTYPSNGNANGNSFSNLTTANVLQHQNLPHLTGAQLATFKNHSKSMLQRKNSNKSVDKGTEEYRRRRERNNIAVRKSREKAKVRSREVEEKVKALLKEKDALMRRLEDMNSEIALHKQIYMQLMNHTNPEVRGICRSFLNMSDHGM